MCCRPCFVILIGAWMRTSRFDDARFLLLVRVPAAASCGSLCDAPPNIPHRILHFLKWSATRRCKLTQCLWFLFLLGILTESESSGPFPRLRHLWQRGTRWTTNVVEVSTLSAADAFHGSPARRPNCRHLQTVPRSPVSVWPTRLFFLQQHFAGMTSLNAQSPQRLTSRLQHHSTATQGSALCSHDTLAHENTPVRPGGHQTGGLRRKLWLGRRQDEHNSTRQGAQSNTMTTPSGPQRMEHTLYAQL